MTKTNTFSTLNFAGRLLSQPYMHLKKQKANSAFATTREASNHQCFRLPEGDLQPFHAQEELPNSSSWFDQVPNFRQEIRQSHYRNDPVKYDLALVTKSFESL